MASDIIAKLRLVYFSSGKNGIRRFTDNGLWETRTASTGNKYLKKMIIDPIVPFGADLASTPGDPMQFQNHYPLPPSLKIVSAIKF